MNFSIYISKKTGEKLANVSRQLQIHHYPDWPENFFDFQPIEDAPDFTKYRKELSGLKSKSYS